ncbi:hypothetical protein HNV12_02090 [Methanococcoides sp. SA1]|nr:hypothetical protein [Methanococcoides sp. SA1]
MKGKLYLVVLIGLILVSSVSAVSDISVFQGQYYIEEEFQQGTFEFRFEIYDDETGGSLIYLDTQNLSTGFWGQWKAELSGVSSSCNDTTKDYFMKISIDNVTQPPRRRLTHFDYLRKDVDETTTGDLTISNILNFFSGGYIQELVDRFIFNKNLEIDGDVNASGSIYSNNTKVCLEDGTNCQSVDSSKWSENGSMIYYNDGNVGIGTDSPTKKLEVADGGLLIVPDKSLSYDSPFRIETVRNGYSDSAFSVSTSSKGGSIGLYEYNSRRIYLSGYENSYFNNNYNLGIGTNSPSEKLEVVGNIKASGNITSNGKLVCLEDGTNCQSVDSSKWSENGSMIYYNSGNVGIGINSPQEEFHVDGSVIFESADGDYFKVRNKNYNGEYVAIDWAGNYPYFHIVSGNDPNNNALRLTNGAIEFWKQGSAGIIRQKFSEPIVFYTGYYDEQMRINPDGDVNISGNITSNGKLVCLEDGTNCQETSSSYWIPNGDDIYYNNGSVGIGTTTPQAKLDINSNTNATLLVQSHNAPKSAEIKTDASGIEGIFASTFYIDEGNTYLPSIKVGSYSNYPLSFVVNDYEQMRIDTSGNVSISENLKVNNKLVCLEDGTNCQESESGTQYVSFISTADATLRKNTLYLSLGTRARVSSLTREPSWIIDRDLTITGILWNINVNTRTASSYITLMKSTTDKSSFSDTSLSVDLQGTTKGINNNFNVSFNQGDLAIIKYHTDGTGSGTFEDPSITLIGYYD